jgi:hypothetical protein
MILSLLTWLFTNSMNFNYFLIFSAFALLHMLYLYLFKFPNKFRLFLHTHEHIIPNDPKINKLGTLVSGSIILVGIIILYVKFFPF